MKVQRYLVKDIESHQVEVIKIEDISELAKGDSFLIVDLELEQDSYAEDQAYQMVDLLGNAGIENAIVTVSGGHKKKLYEAIKQQSLFDPENEVLELLKSAVEELKNSNLEFGPPTILIQRIEGYLEEALNANS